MTEKRFKYILFEGFEENGEPISNHEVAMRLNSLAEENKELRAKSSSWKITASEEISEKQELMKQNVKLKEENEQLKQQIDEMITVFENSGLDYHISDELNEILNR